ncbi:MAG TPA: S41 family peptidase [Candidatus Angelobacter sp.]|nr:S41 family peptidase [Candidatus Angelobacter sp.]
MRRNPVISPRIFFSLVLLCGIAGTAFGQRNPNRTTVVGDSEMNDNLRQFAEVYSLVEENYADPVDPSKTIYEGAIPGMLHVLDPHSNFFNIKSYSSYREEEQGKYQGVGMVIGPRNDKMIVIAPLSGTPAYRAGIRPGDIILGVDGKSVTNMDSNQVSDLLKGPKGTQVVITVAREGSEHPLEFRVVREEIPRNSVDLSFEISPGVGYIHLNGFHETTTREIAAALERFGDLKGLVFDLRGNPGGLLNEAVGVADKFLRKGSVIVSQRGRALPTQVYYAKQGNQGKEYPLVVLVDRGTASAAEIVAGAIQDHDRGLILGETSFGKGLVQSVFTLSESTGLALTTGRYYTPSGRLIQRDYNGLSLYDYYYSRGTEPRDEKAREVRITDGGRTVYGGGGITPDEKVETPKLDHMQEQLLTHYAFFNFAKHYLLNKHITKDFQVTDDVMKEFHSFLIDEKVPYTESELQHQQNWTKAEIKGELFTAEFGQQEGLKAHTETDPMIQKALGLLPQAKQIAENARHYSAQKMKDHETNP